MGKNSGFTMVELMVGIAVVAILAAVAMPNFNRWNTDYKLRGATRDVFSMMQRARLQAVKENANVVVDFDQDRDGTIDGNYFAFVDNGAGGGVANNNLQDGAEKTITTGEMPLKVTLFGSTFPNLRAVFNTRGIIAGNPGMVFLRSTNLKFRGVAVNITGNSRLVTSRDGIAWN